jgi:hypothetical protein
MQVNCPSCGAKVTAEYINIQRMTAVCAACDTVFPFELPETKTKRRKVKQPARLTLRDTEILHMDFSTNFGSDRSEAIVSGAFGSLMLFIALLLISVGRVPLMLPLIFLLVALAMFYWVAQNLVNKTHIEVDGDTIKVTRRPIPNPLTQGYEVSLAGVAAIKYEETAISKKEAYDTPRYRVWAETVDGSRRTIVNDVIEDYAVFIAQHLNEQLHMDDDVDVSRMEDDGHRPDNEADQYEVSQSMIQS